MIEATRSRRVDAGTDEVWATLADFGSLAAWASNVDHSCLLSDQTAGIGAVRRVQLGRTTLVERITEWDEPTVLAYAIEGLPPILGSVVNRWRIQPAGGGALVAVTSEIESGPRPPQRLVARAAARRLSSASEDMLAGLERHLSGSEVA